MNKDTTTRIRKAFVMSVNEGREADYRQRHNPIPDELAEVLKTHGVHNYSIFLHPETRMLFAYVELEDEARWDAVAATGACKRWWSRMAEIMPSHPDNSPVSSELREVFHLA